MKYGLIAVAILVVIGLGYYLMNRNDQMDSDATATSTDATLENEAESNSLAPSATSPSAHASTLTDVNAALGAVGSSARCEWIDGDSGANGLALIKDSKVRVETTDMDGVQTNVIYTAAGTYVWQDGAKTGYVVVGELSPDQEVVSISPRSELEAYIRTEERVRCDAQTLSDSHFIPDEDVTFTTL